MDGIFEGEQDRTGKIDLRTGELAIGAGRKNRKRDPFASRCDPDDRASGLPKDNARNMRSMIGGRAIFSRRQARVIRHADIGTSKTEMLEIDWTVENRYYCARATCFCRI